MSLATQIDGCELVLGIGCARGTSVGLLERGVHKVLSDHRLSASAVRAVASIDRKAGEAGLLALAQRRGWPLSFFTAAQLASVVPEGSERVRAHVGTPGVAEPAALLLAELLTQADARACSLHPHDRTCAAAAAQLLIEKTVYSEVGTPGSMTIAVAQRRLRADG